MPSDRFLPALIEHPSADEPASGYAEASWMIAMLNDQQQVFCGGVLIDARFVATAAHCVAHLSKHQYSLVLAKELSQAAPQPLRVKRLWFSHSYRQSHLYNDFALLELETPLAEVGLPIATTATLESLKRGQSLSIVGFEKDPLQGQGYRTLSASVPYAPTAMCQERWARQFPSVAQQLFEQSICASGNGYALDTCAGDSGGPLLLQQNGVTVLAGLTSFGEPGCGQAEKPSVYTRLDRLAATIATVHAGEAYTLFWPEALVGQSIPTDWQALEISNPGSESWQFGALPSLVEPFLIDQQASTCGERLLHAGQTCTLRVRFSPVTGGVFSQQLKIPRHLAPAITVDMQGYGFQDVSAKQFEGLPMQGYLGGDIVPAQPYDQGFTNGGALVWQHLGALQTSELFLIAEQDMTLYSVFDYRPEAPLIDEPAPAMPNIELSILGSNDETMRLSLDDKPGWQQQRLEIRQGDYLHLHVQAGGRGFHGKLRFDLVSGADQAQLDAIPAAQIVHKPTPIELSARKRVFRELQAGSALWLLLAQIGFVCANQVRLIRRRQA